MISSRWRTLSLVLATAGSLTAAEPSLKPEQLASALQIESVTIPSPGEVFTAIDKAGRPNWIQFQREINIGSTDSREQIALMLGTLVTDGYIAVEAQDGQSVKNTGKEIINLAKKLNVSDNVLSRGNSLNDFAENNEWNTLREELEATQNEVKLSMIDQKDDNLVILVTLGAWVRGIDLASQIVEGAYTPEGAKVLHQPAIVAYLLKQLESLPQKTKDDPLVAELRAGLTHIQELVKPEVPTAENVKAIHEVAGLMVSKIMGNK